MRRACIQLGLFVCFASLYTTAMAYFLEPTDIEFAGWPDYCKTRYVTTNIGQQSAFADHVSPSAVAAVESRIGKVTFLHVHHFCAAMVYFNRAKIESNQGRRQGLLEQAANEGRYTFDRVPVNSPLYGFIAVTLARISHDRGNQDASDRYISLAMSSDAASPLPYISKAIFQRDADDLQEARKTLEEGNVVTQGSSLEIRYNLGLICIELNDFACALDQARIVYDAEYPLMGLKSKLERAGRWPE